MRMRFLVLLILLALSPSARAYIEEVKPSLEVFSGYKPMYFLAGTPETKIQISFKAQLLRSLPFYMAYTQRSYWKIFQKSSPFLDSTYNPEFFYRLPLGDESFTWLDLGLFEHESNGKDGSDSRSWNRAYLRYSTARLSETKPSFYLSFKAWLPYRYEENPEILKSRGLYEITGTVSDFLGPFFERGDLSLTLTAGGDSHLSPIDGGQELTFRTKFLNYRPLYNFVAQLFHGRGETLLNYTQSYWRFRLGVGF